MKKVFRYEDNVDYWNRRWSEIKEDPDRFVDLNVYPVKYANMVMSDPSKRTLEIGCGMGRVVKHYSEKGYNIVGFERSSVAVEKLNKSSPEIDIRVGDTLEMPYDDKQFDVILSFGVYHNLENGMRRALGETSRVLKETGLFCISMRPDNIEMHLNELYWKWRNRGKIGADSRFHKWLVKKNEFIGLLKSFDLITDEIYSARNMSILYRFPFLRKDVFNDVDNRSKGYQLNIIGRIINDLLNGIFPGQFCNVIVFVGHKRRYEKKRLDT